MTTFTQKPNSNLRWNSLRTELLWAYDQAVAEESRCVTADHSNGYWVWLIREGSVQLSTTGKDLTAGAGQWLVSPQRVIRQEFAPGSRILSIHFRCHWPDGEGLFVERDGLVLDADKYPALERSGSRLQQLVNRHLPGVKLEFLRQSISCRVFLNIQILFLQWLIDFQNTLTEAGQTLTTATEGDERLWRVLEFLHAVPLDAPFPEAQLQRESLLGRTHLDRLFCRAYGLSTRCYWEKLRHESAKSSLENSAVPIKEIGYGLGFKQPSHFTKWFIRRAGMTPIEYRTKAVNAPQWNNEFALSSRSSRMSRKTDQTINKYEATQLAQSLLR